MKWWIEVYNTITNHKFNIFFLFVLLLTFEIIISFRSLNYEFYWDDLHLVRSYNTTELKSVFISQWDPNHIETIGYRPLTTVFNDFRATIFGENVMYHRLFILLLLAVTLTIFCYILAKYFRVPFSYSIFGSILAISSRYNWFNLVWIADGIHIFEAFLFMLSLWALLSSLTRRSTFKVILCIFFAGLALFTREDALALLLILPLFGLFYIFQSCEKKSHTSSHTLIRLGYISGFLLILSVSYFTIRHYFVPESTVNINIFGWFTHILWSVFPLGQIGDYVNIFVYGIWILILITVLTAFITVIPRDRQYLGLFWILCIVVSASSGLSHQRANLLFFPILFFSQFFVLVLMEVGKKHTGLRIITILLLFGLIIQTIQLNMLSQLTLHPLSLERLLFTHDIIDQKGTIPTERLLRIKKQEAAMGIRSEGEYKILIPYLIAQAKLNNLRRPNLPDSYAGQFIPPILFSSN